VAVDKQLGLEVFLSYSHADEKLRHELEKHLSPLVRDGLISLWHDRKITAGSEWSGKIDERLKRTHLILLLISNDFVASHFCWSVELAFALDRHKQGRATVVPIILRPVDWHTCPFAHLQALPTDGRPVTNWRSHDDAFADIARQLRHTISERACGISGLSTEVEDTDDSCPSTQQQQGTVATTVEMMDIELTIDGDFDNYPERKKQRLLKAIQSLLEIDTGVTVVKKRRGSIRLTVRLTPVQAERLLWAAKGGELDEHGVADATIVGAEVFTPKSAGAGIAARLEESVFRATAAGVRNLSVRQVGDELVLSGRCRTYYTKQIAQHAAMQAALGWTVVNQIEVV
jgi:TIR domain-containing protein